MTEDQDRVAASIPTALGFDHAEWIGEALPRYLDVLEDPSKASRPTVSTGFRDLDELLNGLEPGSLTVISGRPSTGKSTLLGNFARASAFTQEIPTLWVDQENPHQRVIDRIISAEAKVPLHSIRLRRMNDGDWTRVAQCMGRLVVLPLLLQAGERTDVEQIRRMTKASGAGLVAVDGLQLLKASRDRETREHEVSDTTRALKDLALEADVPVVVTAHLNRVPLQRLDPTPTLNDLRESDLIAHLADTVILIDRPGMRERDSPRAGEADLKVVKHRTLSSCDITVAFQGHYSRFMDMVPGGTRPQG